MAEQDNKLHWTQRVALIRHNLHAASRSGDFTFFRTLQAAGFMEGTNHVAALSAMLGDEADTILAAIDNLNAGLAYAHQDAFKHVYDSVKEALGADRERKNLEARSRLFVDASMQRNLADLAIDKMTSSAINLINSQPLDAQELATNVWVTGMTIIADAIDVSLTQMQLLERHMDDFIRMEESWSIVKASVVFAITGVKGVFELMDPSLPNSNKSSHRNSSIASAGASVFRRLSSAFAPSAASSRSPSVASIGSGPPLSSFSPSAVGPTSAAPVYRTPNFRNSISSKHAPAATSFSPSPATQGAPNNAWAQHKLAVIPATPAFTEDSKDPFDTTTTSSVPSVPEVPEQSVPIGPSSDPFSNELRTTTAVM